MRLIRGRAWKFGDDINTDLIISGKYKFKTLDMEELAKHAMEDLDPYFPRKVERGDLIVAGRNFGCGSSREQAPQVLKSLGIAAVIAGSFARIFFRNALSIGLPALECTSLHQHVETGTILEVDLPGGVVRELDGGRTYEASPIPDFLLRILEDGGVIEHFRKHGEFKWRG